MKSILRLILHIAANAVALVLAARYIVGVSLSGDWLAIAILGLALALLNWLVRPVVKLFMGPLIVLTLGLFTVVVNAAILKLLDFLTPALTIQGYLPLLYATVLISLVNLAFGVGERILGLGKK